MSDAHTRKQNKNLRKNLRDAGFTSEQTRTIYRSLRPSVLFLKDMLPPEFYDVQSTVLRIASKYNVGTEKVRDRIVKSPDMLLKVHGIKMQDIPAEQPSEKQIKDAPGSISDVLYKLYQKRAPYLSPELAAKLLRAADGLRDAFDLGKVDTSASKERLDTLASLLYDYKYRQQTQQPAATKFDRSDYIPQEPRKGRSAKITYTLDDIENAARLMLENDGKRPSMNSGVIKYGTLADGKRKWMGVHVSFYLGTNGLKNCGYKTMAAFFNDRNIPKKKTKEAVSTAPMHAAPVIAKPVEALPKPQEKQHSKKMSGTSLTLDAIELSARATLAAEGVRPTNLSGLVKHGPLANGSRTWNSVNVAFYQTTLKNSGYKSLRSFFNEQQIPLTQVVAPPPAADAAIPLCQQPSPALKTA